MKQDERQPTNIKCHRCGGETYSEIVLPHVKLSCVACGYLKFLKQPWANFIMPVGKYRGKTLGEIKKTDIDYLKWAAANMTGSIGNRINEALNETR